MSDTMKRPGLSRRAFIACVLGGLAAPVVAVLRPRKPAPLYVGDINRATFAYWQGHVPMDTLTFDKLRGEMRHLYTECRPGGNRA